MNPSYLVIHTAAYSGKNCDADKIREWHNDRGWSDIGYHYVILNDLHSDKPDGLLEPGRPEHIQGAHAKGINSISLGICCVGHGDETDFTAAQYKTLYSLLGELMNKYQIPPERVIGHREINRLVDAGDISTQYRTTKSCPGAKVDMEAIRILLEQEEADELVLPTNREIQLAIETLKMSQARFPNARDEFGEFISHPEVLQLIR